MTDRNIFIYGETEVSYLKKRDKKLAEVMEKVGPIEQRECRKYIRNYESGGI